MKQRVKAESRTGNALATGGEVGRRLGIQDLAVFGSYWANKRIRGRIIVDYSL